MRGARFFFGAAAMTARVPACEDWATIARRLAEIEAERQAALSKPAEDEQPPTLDDLLAAVDAAQ